MSDITPQKFEITLTPGQLVMLAEFQRAEGQLSQAAALKLLLEIAFETVTSTGDRFWDKPVTPGDEPRRRR